MITQSQTTNRHISGGSFNITSRSIVRFYQVRELPSIVTAANLYGLIVLRPLSVKVAGLEGHLLAFPPAVLLMLVHVGSTARRGCGDHVIVLG